MGYENKPFVDISETMELPMIILKGISDFSGEVCYFDTANEKSVEAIEETMIMYQYIFIVSQNDDITDTAAPYEYNYTGTIGRIKKIQTLDGDAIRVMVEGICPGEIEEVLGEEPYYKCIVRKKEEEPADLAATAGVTAAGFAGNPAYGNTDEHVGGDDYLDQFDSDTAEISGEISLTEALEAEIESDADYVARDLNNADYITQASDDANCADYYAPWDDDDRQTPKLNKKTFHEKLMSMNKRNVAIIAVICMLIATGGLIVGFQVADVGAENNSANNNRKTVNVFDNDNEEKFAETDSEDSTDTKTTEEDKDKKKTSSSSKKKTTNKATNSAHQHKWVAVYATETKQIAHVTQVTKSVCSICGADVTGNELEHITKEKADGFEAEISKVDEDKVTYIPVTTKKFIGYKCSCGATK